MKFLLLTFVVSCVSQMFVLADPERCSLPKKVGSCRASIPNYFYNEKSGQCEKFMYGGCGGNDNRFMSMDDCVQSCSCHVRPDAGPCKANKQRWYYNPTRGCCEKFSYGGCQGNSNNFQTYDECNKMCSGSFTISLKPAGLNWGSMKISSISGDRSMGGTFGKKFGGSRTVWLHSESAPVLGKGIMEAMSKSGSMQLPGSQNSLTILGKEVTGPGLVKSEKMRKSWSSGPIQTGVRKSMTISGGPVMTGGGMTRMSSQSGPLMRQGGFSMNSVSGKSLNPGGMAVSSQGGLFDGGMGGMAGAGGLLSGGMGGPGGSGGSRRFTFSKMGGADGSAGGLLGGGMGGAGGSGGSRGFTLSKMGGAGGSAGGLLSGGMGGPGGSAGSRGFSISKMGGTGGLLGGGMGGPGGSAGSRRFSMNKMGGADNMNSLAQQLRRMAV